MKKIIFILISGTSHYPIYDKIKQVIERDDTFTFTYKKPKRNFDEDEIEYFKGNVDILKAA